MRIRLALCAPLLALGLFPSIADAALSASSGSASFEATGPAGLRIEGKTTEVAVSEANGTVHVAVTLEHMDTGITLRNRHMREKYLETAKYPTADLVVPRTALTFPEEGKTFSGSAAGTLTIHGTSKPVTFTYRAQRNKSAYDVDGSVSIDMHDYGIQVPSYLGITVKPGIDVHVKFVANDT